MAVSAVVVAQTHRHPSALRPRHLTIPKNQFTFANTRLARLAIFWSPVMDKALSINEFCTVEGISRAFFYKMAKGQAAEGAANLLRRQASEDYARGSRSLA
jgi:hypothetical protein